MIKRCLAIFLATVGVVLLFWLVLPGGWSEWDAADYQSFYKPVAYNLLLGKGLITNDGNPAVRYPPGFPLILTALFCLSQWTGTPERWWLQGFTLFAMGLTCVLLYGLSLMTMGKRIALITALLWMAYPFNLWLTKQPNSEIAFLPLFYSALFFFGRALWQGRAKPWDSLTAGILVGCASLVRPIAILIGALLTGLLIVLRWKNGWKHCALLGMLLLIGNIAVVMPWEIWAWSQTGKWIPLSTGGPIGIRDGLTCFLVTKGFRRALPVTPDERKVIEEAVRRWKAGQLETTGQILDMLQQQVKQNPLGVVRLLARKAGRAWYGTDAQRTEERWVLLIQMVFLAMAVAGSGFLWRQGKTEREWVLMVVVLVFYFWIMTILVLSILRYMVPVMGVLFPSIASALDHVMNKFNRMLTRQPKE